MTSTTAVPAQIISIPSTRRSVARWMLSFLGFPLGGLAAWLLTGPVTDPTSAVTGGLVTGAVLGAAQAWALRAERRTVLSWTLKVEQQIAPNTSLTIGYIGSHGFHQVLSEDQNEPAFTTEASV